MRLRLLIPVLAFALVVGIHAAWHLHKQSAGPWASFEADEAEAAPSPRYLGSHEMWLGLSYATGTGFVALCLARLYENRRRAVAGAAGGLALTGFLYAAGCFLLGCCGSPMLAVYVGLFGPRFLGFTGPLVFGLTLASVTFGYVWIVGRSSRTSRLCEDGCARRVEPASTTPEGG